MNKRRKRWSLWVLVPVLLVTLMWLWLRQPVPEPDPATAEALEAFAETWWQPGGEIRTIPERDWPPELRRLVPEAVWVGPSGLFIQVGSRLVEAWGLFVLPVRSDFRPQEGTDPSFRLLRGRVYRYDIKG